MHVLEIRGATGCRLREKPIPSSPRDAFPHDFGNLETRFGFRELFGIVSGVYPARETSRNVGRERLWEREGFVVLADG